jgi:hypothetical protein
VSSAETCKRSQRLAPCAPARVQIGDLQFNGHITMHVNGDLVQLRANCRLESAWLNRLGRRSLLARIRNGIPIERFCGTGQNQK